MLSLSLSLSIYIYILISAYCWISRLFLFSPLNRSTILPFPFSLSFFYSLSSSFSVPSLPHLASYPRVRMASPSIWGSRLARERGATWRPLWGAPRGCGSRGVGVTHRGLSGSVPREFCPHFWFIPSYELNGFVLSRSSHVWLFATLWTIAARLLCPWDSLGKSTGVGCHALLQGIFPTQGLNLSLLHCRWILYCWATGEANGSKGLHF